MSTKINAKKSNFFYGYVILIAAFLIMAVVWGNTQTFGIFFKPVMAEFGWTRASTAGAFSLSIIVFASLSIVVGRITDRFGPRIVVTACGLVFGLGFLLMSQISAIWQLYIFYGVLIGAGMSSSFVPGASAVTRWFASRRGLMTGLFDSGVGFGMIIMAPVASWLISERGWRHSYIIVGVVTLVILLVAAQFLKRDPSKVKVTSNNQNELLGKNLHFQNEGLTVQNAIHSKQFWLLMTSFAGFGFYQQAVMVHIVPHVTDMGISPTSAAILLSIIGVLSIAGKIGMGAVFDKIGGKTTLIIAFAVMTVALFWLQSAKELWMFYLFAVIFGFGYGSISVLMSPVVAELFGLRAHGAILGIIAFSWGIGAAIGPVLTGSIFDKAGSYHIAFVTCAVLGMTSLVLALLLKTTGTLVPKNGSDKQRVAYN